MSEDEFDNLDRLEPALRNLYLNDEIDEKKYNTELVSIAASFSIAGRRQEASELISRLSSDFIEKELPLLIEADPIYKLKASRVAEFLNNNLDDELEEVGIDLLLANSNKTGLLS